MKLARLLKPLTCTRYPCSRQPSLYGKFISSTSSKQNSILAQVEPFEEPPELMNIEDVASITFPSSSYNKPPLTEVPKFIEKLGTVSRRFKFEYPGQNRALIASYLRGDYVGWHVHYLKEYPEVNRFQRKALFEKECETFMFSENPANFTPEELGFTERTRTRKIQLKIKLIKPTELVLYHDLCEMWKRRQQIDIPYINVGSYVEVKTKSGFPAQPSVTFSGICVVKDHRDLAAYITLRRCFGSQDDDAVEKTISVYSPWVEKIKVLSFQVKNRDNLLCLRDFDLKQSKLPPQFPKRQFLDNGMEVPYYTEQVAVWRKYKTQSRGNRIKRAKDFLPPGRERTLRLHKMWETDPAERYYLPHYKSRNIKR